MPMVQTAREWGPATVMTVGFGEGITEPPMQLVRDAAAIVNGGTLRPATLLAVRPGTEVPGTTVIKPETSATMRELMRLVVASGTGAAANIPGYFVGGKTGTAAKIGANGYHQHLNVSAFICAFPMNAPKYVVYIMLDAPHGDKSTGFFSTAGEVAAPAAGKVIARIAPMLGLLPVTGDAAKAVEAELAMPLQPPLPAGVAPDVIPFQAAAPNGSTVPPPPAQAQTRRGAMTGGARRADTAGAVHSVALR
ncbi:MAG: penicillin-binding protein 2, partial [Rhodospirillales bacterium]|nr:penicillin-binding protein 2 [Rhodospirillales bacterium]